MTPHARHLREMRASVAAAAGRPVGEDVAGQIVAVLDGVKA